MAANDQFWNRDELYEEVWATPMKTLATKYGISDVGLAKVCRKLSIPLPGRGFWAKKDAGQKVERLALPPLKARIVLQKPTPRVVPPKLPNMATPEEISLIERLEQTPADVWLKRGALSHPLIVQARSSLRGAQSDDRKILWTHESGLDIRVSKDSLDRALRIMSGLVHAIEDTGFTVSIEADSEKRREQTIAKIYGQRIRFGLTEKVTRVESVAPPKGGLLHRVLTFGGKPFTLEPSGRLSVEVWTAWGTHKRSWKDGKSPLEDQAFPGLIRLHPYRFGRKG